MLRVLIQTRDIGLKKGSHLINEGTGTAGAGTVHTLVDRGAVKVDDLGILPAELNRDICLRRYFFKAVETAMTSWTKGISMFPASARPPEPVITGETFTSPTASRASFTRRASVP